MSDVDDGIRNGVVMVFFCLVFSLVVFFCVIGFRFLDCFRNEYDIFVGVDIVLNFLVKEMYVFLMFGFCE